MLVNFILAEKTPYFAPPSLITSAGLRRGLDFLINYFLAYRLFDNCFKCFKVADGNFRQSFTVKRYFAFFEGIDKSGVIHYRSRLLQGGRNSGDPEFAKIAFTQFSPNISVLPGMEQSLFGSFVQTGVGAPKAFG
jgi:hypothetical protein